MGELPFVQEQTKVRVFWDCKSVICWSNGKTAVIAYRVASVRRSLATADLRARVCLRAAPCLAEVVGDLAGVDLEGTAGVARLCAHKAGESRGDDKSGVEHVDGVERIVVAAAMNLRASSAKEIYRTWRQ